MASSSNEIVVHSQAGVHDVEALVQAAVSVLTNDMQIATIDQTHVSQHEQNTVQLLVDTCAGNNIQDRLYMCTDCNLAFYGEQGEQEWQWHLRQHKPFKCDLCSEAFEQKESLKTHMRSHTMQMPYICEKCGSAYSLKSNLTQHMKSHEDKLYQCAECNVIFKSLPNLEKHMKFHTGESIKVFQCEQCSKTFSHHKNLVQHMKIHAGGDKTYKCSECPASYAYKCHLTRHLMIHTGDKPYKCKFCSKSFNRNAHLIRHRKIHSMTDKEWKCSQCGFAFWEKSDLLRHVKSHEGNRPFKCEFCEQTFVWRRYLLKHLNNNHRADDRFFCEDCCQCLESMDQLKEHQVSEHSGKKSLTHTCDVCGMEFYFKYKLDEHMYIHTGRKAHTCEKCQQRFVSRKELDRHILEHSQEVSFRCNTCEKSFSSIDQLQSHVKLHTGGGRYMCRECGASYRWRSQLTSHMVVHSNDYDFQCDICQKQFKRKRDLNRHVKIYHDTKPPYTCTECNQDFHSPFNLHKHNTDVHWKRQDAEGDYPCTHCTGIFKVKSDLQRHIVKVHPPRPFVCINCHKRFTMMKFLEKHFELKHEGEAMEEGVNFEVREIKSEEEHDLDQLGDDDMAVDGTIEADIENAELTEVHEIDGEMVEVGDSHHGHSDTKMQIHEIHAMETDGETVIDAARLGIDSQPISEAITLAQFSQQHMPNIVPVYLKETSDGETVQVEQAVEQAMYDGNQQYIITTIDALSHSNDQIVESSAHMASVSSHNQPRVVTIQQAAGAQGVSIHNPTKMTNDEMKNQNIKMHSMLKAVSIGGQTGVHTVQVGSNVQLTGHDQQITYTDVHGQIITGLVAEKVGEVGEHPGEIIITQGMIDDQGLQQQQETIEIVNSL